MKKITISVFALFSLFSLAQEKEIKEAYKALEGGNKTQAQNLITQIESTVSLKSSAIEPGVYAKYLYVKASSLLDQGKVIEAAKDFSILYQYEKGPVYYLRNKATKEKAFLLSKSEVDKLLAEGYSNMKEITSGTSYIQNVIPVLDKKRQEVADVASKEYNAKNYIKASENFLQTYYLSKALGVDDPIFKYYAAVSYHAGKNYEKALELYKNLIDTGYTGVKDIYTALDSNKQKVNLSETDYQLLQKATNSGYTDFKKEKTPSVEADIYNYAVSLLMEQKKYPEALALAEKGLIKLPNDKELSSMIGELYYQTGQMDKYINKLKESIAKDPKDYVSLYNLGVIYSKDVKTYNLAKEYYNKALSIKPDYAVAYLNLAALLLSPDKDIVDQMQKLGNSKADQTKYEDLVKQRQDMFKKALPYMEKAYELDNKDRSIITALEEAYRVLNNREKLNQIRKAEATL